MGRAVATLIGLVCKGKKRSVTYISNLFLPSGTNIMKVATTLSFQLSVGVSVQVLQSHSFSCIPIVYIPSCNFFLWSDQCLSTCCSNVLVCNLVYLYLRGITLHHDLVVALVAALLLTGAKLSDEPSLSTNCRQVFSNICS